MAAWVIDVEGVCQLLVDDHVPVYVANEVSCMEVINEAREWMESLICVMECHFGGHSWGKAKEVVNVMLVFVKGKSDDADKGKAQVVLQLNGGSGFSRQAWVELLWLIGGRGCLSSGGHTRLRIATVDGLGVLGLF